MRRGALALVAAAVAAFLLVSSVMASEEQFDGKKQLFRGDHFEATRYEMKDLRRLPDRERFGPVLSPAYPLAVK